jgi:hypothetical protein
LWCKVHGHGSGLTDQAGLANCENVITGPEFEALSDEALAARVKEVGAFAQLLPEY